MRTYAYSERLRWSMMSFDGFFRSKIKSRMSAHRVTTHELAKVLNGKVSRRTLFNFLDQQGNITLRRLEAILGVLDLDVVIEVRTHLGPDRRLKEMPHWRDAVIAYDRRRKSARRSS